VSRSGTFSKNEKTKKGHEGHKNGGSKRLAFKYPRLPLPRAGSGQFVPNAALDV
jgi:hypothetical protein